MDRRNTLLWLLNLADSASDFLLSPRYRPAAQREDQRHHHDGADAGREHAAVRLDPRLASGPAAAGGG